MKRKERLRPGTRSRPGLLGLLAIFGLSVVMAVLKSTGRGNGLRETLIVGAVAIGATFAVASVVLVAGNVIVARRARGPGIRFACWATLREDEWSKAVRLAASDGVHVQVPAERWWQEIFRRGPHSLQGVLTVTDEGLTWTPGRRARKRFAATLRFAWRDLGGARITSYRFLPVGSYLTIQVADGPWLILDVFQPGRLGRALEPHVRVSVEREV